MRNFFNFIGFQIAWFSCILGAASGFPWLGLAATLFVACVHLRFSADRQAEAQLGGVALTLGLAADSLGISTGAIDFPPQSRLGWPIPAWMPALWLNLALTLNHCLSWLKGRYFLSAVFGAVGGPLSYYAGCRFGAIDLDVSLLWVVALEWAVATPLLQYAAQRVTEGSWR